MGPIVNKLIALVSTLKTESRLHELRRYHGCQASSYVALFVYLNTETRIFSRAKPHPPLAGHIDNFFLSLALTRSFSPCLCPSLYPSSVSSSPPPLSLSHTHSLCFSLPLHLPPPLSPVCSSPSPSLSPPIAPLPPCTRSFLSVCLFPSSLSPPPPRARLFVCLSLLPSHPTIENALIEPKNVYLCPAEILKLGTTGQSLFKQFYEYNWLGLRARA